MAKKVEAVALVRPRAIACVCALWPWLYCQDGDGAGTKATVLLLRSVWREFILFKLKIFY